MQTELPVISIGDRVTWTEDYLQSMDTPAYHALRGMQGTVQSYHQGYSTRVWVLWDGEDRPLLAAVNVLARLS